MDFIRDLLMGPAYAISNAIWNLCMALITGVMTTTPEEFSREAWDYVTEVLFPWSQAIAIALLNLFFMIGYIKQVSNLKEDVTIQTFIKSGFRLLAANGLIQGMLPMIQIFFRMASLLTGQVMMDSVPVFAPEELDGGLLLFFFIFGILYFIVALICGGVILMVVYGRYLNLYMLIVLAPIGVSTLAGDEAISRSGIAMIKTFLSNTFEIVVIAIILGIAGRMIPSINFGRIEALEGLAGGFTSVIQSMFTMVLTAGAVKAVDIKMKRSLAL